MYNKIQECKQLGYSMRRCAKEIKLDRKTVQKYWNMTEKEYIHYLAECQERSKMLEPYREEMVGFLEQYPHITAAIIYDRLCAHHSEFKPSYRSVRAYVTSLREECADKEYK